MSYNESISLPFDEDDPFGIVSLDYIDNPIDSNEEIGSSERDYHLLNSVMINVDQLDPCSSDVALYPIDQSTEIQCYGEDESFAAPDIDGLSKTIASCYLLNNAYRVELELLRDNLEDKLQANLAMQEELMNSEALANEFIHPNSMLKFLAPYFRDAKNFAPEDNDETKSRKTFASINMHYIRLKKPWKDSDRLSLRVAVQNYITKRDMEPFTIKANRLLEEINELKARRADEDIIEEKSLALEDQRRKIESIRMASTAPSRELSSEIDWLEVSKFCPTLYTEFDCEIQWTNVEHPSINHGNWTHNELEKLESLVKSSYPDWERIVKELGTNRVAWQCCQKYQSDLNPKMVNSGPFTTKEINLLKKLIAELSIGKFIPWHQVAYFMERRTLTQIKNVWTKMQRTRNRVKWSDLEDEVLIAAVKKVGTHWHKVANYIPGRTNKQCRERYMMRLGITDRKLADWTFTEDLKLVTIAPNLKFRWVEVMAHLTKRNARQIAARYDTIERCKVAKAIETSKDLRDLVPRKKSNIKHNIPQLQLEEGKTIDEFLRESRKELENWYENAPRKVTRPGVGGRKRKLDSDEAVEQELIQRFKLYPLMGQTSKPSKRIDRAVQETMVFDVLQNVLTDYLSNKSPNQPHLLASVVSSVLRKVIGLNPSGLSHCPPIFPPNMVTTRSYQVLLFMRQRLEQQLTDYSFDSSQHTQHPHYRALLGLVHSLYFWPCLLSKQRPNSIKPPQESSLSSSGSSSSLTLPQPSPTATSPSTKKSSAKRRRKSQPAISIDHCNNSREKQRRLFASYEDYLSNSN